MSAAELRTRVCFHKRLSLAEGARIFFAVDKLGQKALTEVRRKQNFVVKTGL